jgi:hypothetical protein
MCPVIIWTLGYALLDAAPDGAEVIYFAFINYMMVGWGDVLLFGWSTGVIFEVLRGTARHHP